MKKIIIFLPLIVTLIVCSSLSAQVQTEIMSVDGNIEVNGNPEINPALNGNANATIALGTPGFPGCVGRFGRFCRTFPGTNIPDGRYDLIRYLNLQYNPLEGGFTQIDPAFDAWVDGPCIAPGGDPGLTGFGIGYVPADQGAGAPVTPMPYLHIAGGGEVGLGTNTPLTDLHLNGTPVTLNDGTVLTNPVLGFGLPGQPGCLGRFGRFCRLDQFGFPDGRYDLIRYLNATFDGQQFQQIDSFFDVWVDGPCIAQNTDPATPNPLTGWDIGYAPAGNTGDISPVSRFRIDGEGNVGICSSIPGANLDVQNEDATTTTFRLGLTPNNVSRCVRVWCPGTSDYRWEYFNADFNSTDNVWTAPNPGLGSFRTQICAGPNGGTWEMGPGFDDGTGGGGLLWNPSVAVNGQGNVGINNPVPEASLHVFPNPLFPTNPFVGQFEGEVSAFNFVPISDARYKKNIRNLEENSLEKITQLQGVNYEFRKEEFPKKNFNDRTQIGFIAQDVQEVFPEVVSEDSKGYMGVNYTALIPVLTEAVKELKTENELIKAENDVLKDELAQVKNRMVAIEAMLSGLDENANEGTVQTGDTPNMLNANVNKE